MSDWLDTETKVLLQHVPPEKYAPPETGMFSLVLLKRGADTARLAQTLERIRRLPADRAALLVSGRCPLLAASSLSLADAFLWQFELVCSDSISVFMRDEIISSSSPEYLASLYLQLQGSSEFEEIAVVATSIPQDDAGGRFVNQFLGGREYTVYHARQSYSYRGKMMRKKARIMAHWAKKIGAEVLLAGKQ